MALDLEANANKNKHENNENAIYEGNEIVLLNRLKFMLLNI